MLNIVFLSFIFVIFITVCKKNVSSRYSELNNNFEAGKSLLQSTFFDLPNDKKEEFIESLDSKELSFLEFILNNQKAMHQNLWSSQQGIVLMQDLLNKLNKFTNRNRA